ncbi:MAG: ABC transporter ATP-binding protein [Pseudomonadota bacterium]
MQDLNVIGVSKSYGPRTVVDGVNLTLKAGEITALLGQSGAGKTTLLRLIAGMETPDQGEIKREGQILSHTGWAMPIEDREIGLVFQDFALFPHLTVRRNITFGLSDRSKQDQASLCEAWLKRLNLSHRADAYPHQLSGGEQQRVALARALAPDPKVILLDEPFSGLDPALREAARSETLTAVRTAGIPALMVTHDALEALGHADQLAIMADGQLIQAGSPHSVYTNPTSYRAAEALGPLVEVPSGLRDAFKLHPGSRWMRPEAVRLTPQADGRFVLSNVQRRGPLCEFCIDLGNGHEVKLQQASPLPELTTGNRVTVDLNTDLVFDFADHVI